MVNSPPTEDLTPCLTLSSSGTGNRAERYIDNIFLPLPDTHPLYNPEKKEQKYPFEASFQKKGIRVIINIWADNENERIKLQNQTLQTLHESINYHHKYCTHYTKDTRECENLNTQCKAINNNTSRGSKGQCPKPQKYGYKNILTENHIIPHSITIGTPFNLDDYTKNPIQLHTVIELDMDYYEIILNGGSNTPTYTFKNNNTIIEGGKIT